MKLTKYIRLKPKDNHCFKREQGRISCCHLIKCFNFSSYCICSISIYNAIKVQKEKAEKNVKCI